MNVEKKKNNNYHMRITLKQPVKKSLVEQLDSTKVDHLFGSTQMSFIAAPYPPQQIDSKRFTPFSTILRGSAGWVDFAKKNQEEIGVREILKNQLSFN